MKLSWPLRWLLVAALLLLGAELGSRLDDWYHSGTPLLSTPSREFDLTYREPWGLRGRSNGHYRKWQLNSFGFRGDEITRLPSDEKRIFVLGSSETFGVFEQQGNEYPALLNAQSRRERGWEVVNVSMAGMAVNRAIPYWTHWLRQFEPDVVLVYANPLFYLREEVPEVEQPTPSLEQKRIPPPSPRPRLLLRVEDSARNALPLSLRTWNRQRQAAAIASSQGDNWQFIDVPADRLDAYESHVTELCEQIRRDGATPILATFAFRSTSTSDPSDEFYFVDMQTHFPRSTSAMLGDYAIQANERLRALSNRLDIPLIDVDRNLTGQRDLFVDLVHFNDKGAKAMADFLFGELLQLFPPKSLQPASSP